MNPASVGFQCPEELADARATVRAPKRTTGVRVAGRRWGPVTLTLVALNVAVGLATVGSALLGGGNPRQVLQLPADQRAAQRSRPGRPG